MTSAGHVNVTRLLPRPEAGSTGSKGPSGHASLAMTALRARRFPHHEREIPMSEEMTADQIYATYFGPDGQPVRAGVVLSEQESLEYAQYFDDTTDQTITEETDR